MRFDRIRGLIPQDREVRLFLIYSAAFHIGLFGVADVVMNFYFVSLGHNPEVIGLLQSQPRLAGLLTSLPLGLLATRMGVHRMLTLSTIGVTAILLLKVAVPTLPMLTVTQFALGVVYGGQQIAIAPMMITLVPSQRRTQFFAVHNVIAMATMAAGSFIGGYLPAAVVRLSQHSAALKPEDAQTPYAYGATIVIGAVIVVAGLIPFWFVRTGRKPRGPKVVAVTSEPTPWRQLALFAAPMLAFGFTGGLTFPFYNLFFRTRFDLPDESVGIILSIGWMGMALIPLLNPWWERRFGRARALGITLSIAATSFLLMAAAPTLGLCLIAFIAAISFRNAMQPLFQPLVLDRLAPALHNNASSMSMVMWNIGWYIATLLSGSLQKNFGFGVILTIVAIGVFITATCVVLIFQRYEPVRLKRA